MRERRFMIDSYTPLTLPMVRLAQYINDLATLFGEPDSVHFLRVDPGSAALVHAVEDEAVTKIDERLSSAVRGEGAAEQIGAFHRINNRLREDNGIGVLVESSGAEIIKFPGRTEVQPITFSAFNQQGSIDGTVILVGGRTDPVPVHIQSVEEASQVRNCYAARNLAKVLGGYIFGPEVRVSGTGRWLRDSEGHWSLERFTITSFEVLSEQTLGDVVARLREVKGSTWESLKDPWAGLDTIRNGSFDRDDAESDDTDDSTE
jgi:hypothetical protein